MTQQFERKVCIIRKFDCIFAVLLFASLTYSTVLQYSTCSKGCQDIYCFKLTVIKQTHIVDLPVLQREEMEADKKPTTDTYLFDQELQNGERST